MAFKLKGGVGGPFRKNYPSAFKHPSSDPSEHPHKKGRMMGMRVGTSLYKLEKRSSYL